MHGVNLDLLRAGARHHPDGRPRDAHAHHRLELAEIARAQRQARWRKLLGLLRRALRRDGRSAVLAQDGASQVK